MIKMATRAVVVNIFLLVLISDFLPIDCKVYGNDHGEEGKDYDEYHMPQDYNEQNNDPDDDEDDVRDDPEADFNEDGYPAEEHHSEDKPNVKKKKELGPKKSQKTRKLTVVEKKKKSKVKVVPKDTNKPSHHAEHEQENSAASEEGDIADSSQRKSAVTPPTSTPTGSTLSEESPKSQQIGTLPTSEQAIKKIGMVNIFDADPAINELLQSTSFQNIRKAQIRDYINSHFAGQDLSKDVMETIDNLITTNLRNELRDKNSQLNRMFFDKPEAPIDSHQTSHIADAVKTENSQASQLDEISEMVAATYQLNDSHGDQTHVQTKSQQQNSTAGIKEDANQVVSESTSIDSLVQPSTASYPNVNQKQTIVSTPSLSSTVQPSSATVLTDAQTESHTVSNIYTTISQENKIVKGQISTSSEVVAQPSAEPIKPKRKNLMKQALKGMHTHLHTHDHFHQHEHTEESHHNDHEGGQHHHDRSHTIINEKQFNQKETVRNEEDIPAQTQTTEGVKEISLFSEDVNNKDSRVSAETQNQTNVVTEHENSISQSDDIRQPSLQEEISKPKIDDHDGHIKESDSEYVLQQNEDMGTQAAKVESKEVKEETKDKQETRQDGDNDQNLKSGVGVQEEVKEEPSLLSGLISYFSADSTEGENVGNNVHPEKRANEAPDPSAFPESTNNQNNKDQTESSVVHGNEKDSQTAPVEGTHESATQQKGNEEPKSATQKKETEKLKLYTQKKETETCNTDSQQEDTEKLKSDTQREETENLESDTQKDETGKVKSDTQKEETVKFTTATQHGGTAKLKSEQISDLSDSGNTATPVIFPSIEITQSSSETSSCTSPSTTATPVTTSASLTQLAHDEHDVNEKDKNMKVSRTLDVDNYISEAKTIHHEKENTIKPVGESVDLHHETSKYTKPDLKEEVIDTIDQNNVNSETTALESSAKSETVPLERDKKETRASPEDDDPLIRLCKTHPTLLACQKIVELHDGTNAKKGCVVNDTSYSVASYIKSFTRWINHYFYSTFSYTVGSIKVLVSISLQYSVGILLSSIGHNEITSNIMKYLDFMSTENFAMVLVIIINHIVFYWYFNNSSMQPRICITEYPGPVGDSKEIHIQEQVVELEQKLSQESKEKQELLKEVAEQQENTAKITEENKELMRKVKESECDKESIESLRQSSKEYEEKLLKKECELTNFTASLESSQEDIDSSKSELKQLEDKFFYVIKELDTKDAAIARMEENEEALKQQLEEKQENVETKEDTISTQNVRINDLAEENNTLQNNIDDEKQKSHTLELEIQVLQETLLALNKTGVDHETSSEFETVEGDSEIDAEQLKVERLAKIMDTTKIQAELKETKTELLECKQDLVMFKTKSSDVEEKFDDLHAKHKELCKETTELKKNLEKKEIELTTIERFFGERENDFQRLNASKSEEIKTLKKQIYNVGDNEKHIDNLLKQVEDLKEEILMNERQYKQQLSAAEEQSHSNYLKMRTAVRECDEHKREKEIYRKRLLDIDMSPQFKSSKISTPVSSKPTSERAVSPSSNNQSTEENNTDSLGPQPQLQLGPVPAMPSPFGTRMYRAQPPPFLPRPTFGIPRPMGPYGIPPRPPFMSPLGQRPPASTTPSAVQPVSGLSQQQHPMMSGLHPSRHPGDPVEQRFAAGLGMGQLPTALPQRPPVGIYGIPPETPPMMTRSRFPQQVLNRPSQLTNEQTSGFGV